MARKADALDAVKISSRGQSLEMGEVVEIPKRGRKPKQANIEAEAPKQEPALVQPEPAVVAAPVEPEPVVALPPVKVEAYLILKTCKIWVGGTLITLNQGKKVSDNSFGPGTLSKLKSRGVEMKLLEM